MMAKVSSKPGSQSSQIVVFPFYINVYQLDLLKSPEGCVVGSEFYTKLHCAFIEVLKYQRTGK